MWRSPIGTRSSMRITNAKMNNNMIPTTQTMQRNPQLSIVTTTLPGHSDSSLITTTAAGTSNSGGITTTVASTSGNAANNNELSSEMSSETLIRQQNALLMQRISELEQRIVQLSCSTSAQSAGQNDLLVNLEQPTVQQTDATPEGQTQQMNSDNIHMTPPQTNNEFTFAGSTPFVSLNTIAPTMPSNTYQPYNNIQHPLAVQSIPVSHSRKLQDLPIFSGKAEEWPMFEAAFNFSTAAYNYTTFENSQRLHKSLKAEAREAVSSLLIHPDNVEFVMKQLKFMFGRPDQLIGSQLNIIRKITPIRDNNIEEIVPFANKVNNFVTFLRSLNSHHHMANPTVLEELVAKLPISKRIDWAKQCITIQPYPTLINFALWLNELAQLVSLVQGSKSSSNFENKRRVILHASDEDHQSKNKCVICKGQHKADNCKQFLAQTVQKRWELAKRHRLCFSCLGHNHMTQICRFKKNCGTDDCDRKHHKLLHGARVTTANNEDDHSSVLSCNDNTVIKQQNLLFRILPVTLYGKTKQLDTFALLDEGSSVTLVDTSILENLDIKGPKRNLNISWFGGKSTTQRSSVVDIEISGIGMEQRFVVNNAYGVANIDLPTQSLDADNVQQELNISLVSYRNAKPLLLIGLDNCHLSTAENTIDTASGGPYAANTKLGWVLYGPQAKKPNIITSCLMIRETKDEIHNIITNYFEEESFGVKIVEPLESNDDVRARAILKCTTKKVGERYQAGLLWQVNKIEMPQSFAMAERRLVTLERKLQKDDNFAKEYGEIIESYVKKGYARKLPPCEANIIDPRSWYLPHFAVINPNKVRKVRMVFDAAARVNGVSLNSNLLKGPQEYRPLPAVLFNFRIGKIAVCADIKEMFHQVLIQPEDRKAQQFLWRDCDQTRTPDIYQMEVMIFGAACSPCIAQHVKTINALQFQEEMPRAVKAIIENHYVDDFVDSFDSAEEAITISKQVREIHKCAGFELRKFTSNCKELLIALDVEVDKHSQFDKAENGSSVEKVLGMYWQPEIDAFKYHLKIDRIDSEITNANRLPTKRELLSIAMSVFDPLGFLSHFMINAKLLMREVWRSNVGWDEPIPENLQCLWSVWLADVKKVEQLEIPRLYYNIEPLQQVELHIFVDASADAFVAVAYWRVVNNDIQVSFVSGKTKCAPMKPMSVPRLELQAAVLGSRLKSTILKCHPIEIVRCVMWSDSKTVLKWINSATRRYTPFVSHRISEILSHTDCLEWRWVPTEENVADDATRVNKSTSLEFSSRWFQGPKFLKLSEELWPAHNHSEETECNEELLKPKFTLLTVSQNLIKISKFSSYSRLIRTTAWVLRFLQKIRKQYHDGNQQKYGLTAAEINKAENLIAQQAQNDVYSKEITALKGQKQLQNNSTLIKLLPYIDESGVMRVGGRLGAASWLPIDVVHPIILPPEHELTTLIVASYHTKFLHQNVETVINEIRRKYWIERLRQIVRKIITACQYCKIKNAKTNQPIMSQLPMDRVTPYVRPFTYTGIDYFGPVNITIGRRQEKRWVALFTCLTIRAIHLEIARDLSTDACILVIRNFMNRRGIPQRMLSDNGKNFVGLSNCAKSFEETFDCERIQAELSNKGAEWIFNCPRNPAEGGIWERMIQCVKRALRHTLKEKSPHEHTLQTLLIEAENIINSRPLTHIPIALDDDEPLTPNHFLIGYSNAAKTIMTEEEAVSYDGLRKQWRIAKQLRNQFWKKWILEYLPTLTRRVKWCQHTQPVKPGDLVFISDENIPRQQWCRGKVVEIFYGKDGQVRRADVLTKLGVVKRAVSRLAVLDVE